MFYIGLSLLEIPLATKLLLMTICRYHLFNEDHEINTCFFLDRPQLSVRKYNARRVCEA